MSEDRYKEPIYFSYTACNLKFSLTNAQSVSSSIVRFSIIEH